MEEVQINAQDYAVGKRIVDLHFPDSAFISMIKRKDNFVRPGGSTIIEEEDILVVLLDHKDSMQEVKRVLQVGFSAV
ncbi:TrkA C-terminal domain-containing protein [Mesonia sp. HuA40]|uniref:TrkA C-terminal domain-containing protein n=1 Tax=Mesonia sp. HuA40 TaxID=2602761 RepID=UPI001C9BF465|nr:TrkA C-terminal domain-containing protein [Mesonia sp. HuA40]